VILAALRLVEHASGSVIIKDFPGKDPRARPDPGWRPPLDHAAVADRSAGMIASELKTEIELLRAVTTAGLHGGASRASRRASGLPGEQ
jgi:hypothetical protein